jgi:hypothetical protein
MGFRFRRQLQIFPGLTLNLGKPGVSVSLGVEGAHVTRGPKGVRTTVGLPGTGLSWTNYQPHQRPEAPPPEARQMMNDMIAAAAELAVSAGALIKDLLGASALSVAERVELHACRDLLEPLVGKIAGAVYGDLQQISADIDQLNTISDRADAIAKGLLAARAQQREELKDKLITGDRRTADIIAQLMRISGLTPAERDEMRACCDQLERYVKVAETETVQDEELASLADKMSGVTDQFCNIADRIEARLASGQ